ncbi:putative ribonuclease H-like domain-containing protein [Tanacetum coccineum]
MGLNDLINWYQSHGALDLGFKVLWSKNEGTDEVLEGTAQEYESTAGANLSTAEVYESTAHSLFKISGIEVAKTKEGMVLSQRKYTLDILEDVGMTGCRPSTFPMEQNLKLDKVLMTRRIQNRDYLLLLGGAPISWKTKKQSVVSKSSAEAEYRAMSNAVSEILWMRWLLGELDMAHRRTNDYFVDKSSLPRP